jgi:sigma-B regulation protein RsbU (phosphoserine phosphatase)
MAWTAHTLSDHLTTAGITIRPGYESGYTAALAGVLLIIIAEVFRQGALMKRDIETAREIQFELVPDPRFEERNVSIYSQMRPANTVGGDYYDIVPLEAGRVAVVLGDVSGKGMPAALLMSLLQGSLKALISAGFRGTELVAKLNTSLCRNTPGNKMVTLFYGELDTGTGDMLYVNAGHNAPFLMRADGGMDRLHSTGTVLGVLEEMAFEAGSLTLYDGDTMLLFTDGLSEAFNAREEEFGEARLLGSLQRLHFSAPMAFVDSLVTEVTRFCHPAQPTDDMTLMLLLKKSPSFSATGA